MQTNTQSKMTPRQRKKAERSLKTCRIFTMPKAEVAKVFSKAHANLSQDELFFSNKLGYFFA